MAFPKKVYGAVALTGGAGVGALDSHDGAALQDLDIGYVNTIDTFYPYSLDEDSGLAESSPSVISPDASAGIKRWILSKIYAKGLNLFNTTEQLRLGYDASNYWSGTVGSTGGLTLAGVGAGGALDITPTAGQNVNVNLSGNGIFDIDGKFRTNNNIYNNGGITNITGLNDVLNVNKNLSANATDSWSTRTAGGTARSSSTSVLYNGKIYSWGGTDGADLNTVDIYDIATDSWSTSTAGGTARADHTSVLYNGKIYSWGGYGGANLNTVDIYDIATDSWSTGTAGGTARRYHSSVLYNGKIYSWGGIGGAYLNTVDIYDIGNKQTVFSIQENGIDTFAFQTGSQLFLNNGRISIVGGNINFGDAEFGTSTTNVMGFTNGTAPTNSPANMVQLWAEDVTASSELRVRDEGGTVTTLSPHAKDAPDWLYDRGRGLDEMHRSANHYKGEITFINETRKNNLIQLLFEGKPMPVGDAAKFQITEPFAEYNLRTGENLQIENWDANQQLIKKQADAKIAIKIEDANMAINRKEDEIAMVDAEMASGIAEEITETIDIDGNVIKGETRAEKRSRLVNEKDAIIIPELYKIKTKPAWLI